jgi:hypothetical protein
MYRKHIAFSQNTNLAACSCDAHCGSDPLSRQKKFTHPIALYPNSGHFMPASQTKRYKRALMVDGRTTSFPAGTGST